MSGKRNSKIIKGVAQKQQAKQPLTPKPETLGKQEPGAAATKQARLDPTALSPGEVLQLQRTLGNQAVDRLITPRASSGRQLNPGASAVIQRDVGLEIESSPDWQAYNAQNTLITGQHLQLLSTPQYRLETELSGKLEFVIEPPVKTTNELVALVKELQGIVEVLKGAKSKKGTGFDPFMLETIKKQQSMTDKEIKKSPLGSLVYKDVELIPLWKVYPDAPRIYISKGPGEFQGGFQATVGLHPSAIPFLFERLSNEFLAFPKKEQLKKATQTAEMARQQSVGLPVNTYKQISPEMEGLLNLIYYYIFAGRDTRDRRPFPKGITQVMARTNFAHMFSLMPEASFFANKADFWVGFVTKAANLNPDDKIFHGSFGDTDKDETTLDLTYREWLLGMVGTAAQRGTDKLSVKGGGPEILKTMGDKDKTDDLGEAGPGNRGVILELRGLDAETIPVGDWDKYARRIGNMVDELNARNNDREKARRDVFQAGHGAQLFWSPLNEQAQAGSDVSGMAIEAAYAPFAAQVEGLMKRARTRAEEAMAL